MKNTLILLLATATLFPILSYADFSSDNHRLTITVPEVRLLHIKNFPGGQGGSENTNILTFQKDPDTRNSAVYTSYSAKGFYDITANVEAGTSKTRSIIVSAAGINKDWKLSVSSAALSRAFVAPVTLTNSINSGELVSGVSNIAMRDIELTYKLEPIFPTVASSLNLPTEGLELTFTLTDDA